MEETIDIICYNPTLITGHLISKLTKKIIIIKGNDLTISSIGVDKAKIRKVFSQNANIVYEGVLRYNKKTYRIYKVSSYSSFDKDYVEYAQNNDIIDLYGNYDPLYFMLTYRLFYKDSAIYISAKNKKN